LTERITGFLDEFTLWAGEQPDIQAAVLVGSYARNAAAEGSDIDLIIITTQPERYLHQIDWARRFGRIIKHQTEDYGLVVSLRVWYADGREVEYGLTDERWYAEPLDEGTLQVIKGGMCILFEQAPVLSLYRPDVPPDQAASNHAATASAFTAH
jgi:predicted nucleotidyltransferase